MDDHRFDDLTRAIAGQGSRRGLLRGLLAAATLAVAARRPFTAAARHARLGPGDPCRTDDECLAADAPLICADNGFAVDGPLNCCTYEGSRCGSDQACCWDNACVDGVCASIGNFPGPGERCNSFSQCVAADTALACDYVGATDDYRCCARAGDRCGSDSACCGYTACFDGRCRSQGDIAGPGEPCVDSSQCVAADAALACDYVGRTDDFRCCAYEGDRCSWDGACCGWLRCSGDGFCTGAPPTGCDGEGCDCDFHDPNACAGGLVCCAVQSGFICATRANCGG